MNKNVKTAIIGASIIGGCVGLYFIGKAIVKKIQFNREEDRKKKVKTETGTGEINTAQQVEEEASKSYSPSSDMKILATHIVGVNTVCHTEEVNSVVMALTDSELKKLNSAWKEKYKVSLYKYLDDEFDNAWFFANCYPEAMKRLSNIGLR